jgi:hypothetical protein
VLAGNREPVIDLTSSVHHNGRCHGATKLANGTNEVGAELQQALSSHLRARPVRMALSVSGNTREEPSKQDAKQVRNPENGVEGKQGQASHHERALTANAQTMRRQQISKPTEDGQTAQVDC